MDKPMVASVTTPLTPANTTPTWMRWTGRVISVLPVLGLVMSGVMKVTQPPEVLEGMAKFGFDTKLLIPLAIIELASAAIYLIPQTAVLGAVLLTGYLGGAIVTHLRVGDGDYWPAIIMGVLVWLGLFLRDSRVRSLLPWRSL